LAGLALIVIGMSEEHLRDLVEVGRTKRVSPGWKDTPLSPPVGMGHGSQALVENLDVLLPSRSLSRKKSRYLAP
jgi:hypothetical protein